MNAQQREPLMAYHTTKDMDAVVAALKGTVERDPERVGDIHLHRMAAAFFYTLVLKGEIPLTFAYDLVMRDERMKMMRKKHRVRRLNPDGTEAPEPTEPPTPEEMQAVNEMAISDECVADATQDGFRWAVIFTSADSIMRVWAGKYSAAAVLDVMWATVSSRLGEQIVANTSPGMEVTPEMLEELRGQLRQEWSRMFQFPPEQLLTMPTFDQPGFNDLCYTAWGASGDRRFIERVIKVLDQPGPQPVKGDRDMVNVSPEALVPVTAAWSLRSLCEQEPEIAAIVDSIPGARDKMEWICKQ